MKEPTKIKNRAAWDAQVKLNTDPYGKAVIRAARAVMLRLEKHEEPIETGCSGKHTAYGILCGSGRGLSGFQADCVVSIVHKVHERGPEFSRAFYAARKP